jgi:hypothetical protein
MSPTTYSAQSGSASLEPSTPREPQSGKEMSYGSLRSCRQLYSFFLSWGSLYTLLQVFSVTLFEKMPMSQAFSESTTTFEDGELSNQLNLFDY